MISAGRAARIVATLVVVAATAAGCGQTTQTERPVASSTTVAETTTTAAPVTTTTSLHPSTTAPPTSGTIPPTTQPAAQYAWRASSISSATQTFMTGRSWKAGCPVAISQLRLVELTYWGFDGTSHWGQLVVNADSVSATVGAFRRMYAARFPIRQMRLVDNFGADDEASMAADNTSAFNCRIVPGTSTWSQHAYGRAVDINPLENPEIQGGQIDPPSAAPWADRTQKRTGMIHHGDAVWASFAAVGWLWGGDWSSLKDYQHFSANGL